MGMHHQFSDADRVSLTLIAGLEYEFGKGAGASLAERFLAAEAIDFHWEARTSERWLGSYESADDDALELDRVAICGRLDGCWFAAICIIDGEGRAHGLMGQRRLATARAARQALIDAR